MIPALQAEFRDDLIAAGMPREKAEELAKTFYDKAVREFSFDD